MNTHIVICCHVVLLIALGCNTVTIQKPFGQFMPVADQKMLEGTWINNDGEVVKIHISQSGDVTLGSMNWDDKTNQFHVETIKLVLTRVGKFKFIHIKQDGGATGQDYQPFCLYETTDDKTIRIYPPIVSVFEAAVESGKLKGQVKELFTFVDVRINASDEDLIEFFLHSQVNTCFEQKPALTLNLLNQ